MKLYLTFFFSTFFHFLFLAATLSFTSFCSFLFFLFFVAICFSLFCNLFFFGSFLSFFFSYSEIRKKNDWPKITETRMIRTQWHKTNKQRFKDTRLVMNTIKENKNDKKTLRRNKMKERHKEWTKQKQHLRIDRRT